MNESDVRPLKVLVERAVRPVRATNARKRRMREELLGHLVATFEEELGRDGDTLAARERARQRFGDPATLSGELQRTVPSWDRLCAVSEKLELQPGESVWRFAGKHLVGSFVLFAGNLLLMLPWLILHRELEMPLRILVVARIVAAMTLFTGVVMFSFMWVPYRMGETWDRLRSGSRRAMRAMMLYGVWSLAVLPAAAFVVFWLGSGDWTLGLLHLRFALWFAPAAPLLFLLVARLMAKQRRERQAWAELDVS